MQYVQRGFGKEEVFNLTEGVLNGYSFYYNSEGISSFIVWDMGVEIERIEEEKGVIVKKSLGLSSDDLDVQKLIQEHDDIVKTIEEFQGQLDGGDMIDVIGDIYQAKLGHQGRMNAKKIVWALARERNFKNNMYLGENDIIPYYLLQEELKTKVIRKNSFSKNIRHIAGVDVAYNELEHRMIGAIVVLDADTFEVVDQAWHEMEITFPYIPGLFSFREVPPILAAFEKLKIKPELIICDAQGIAHPKGVGMATHLGIELDIPTIGCAKKRLIGNYEKNELGKERGSLLPLIWDSAEVGVALRTQSDVKPMFVSIGHKIDLQTSIDWILKLCSKFRLPETVRHADQLVNSLMRERTKVDLMRDEEG